MKSWITIATLALSATHAATLAASPLSDTATGMAAGTFEELTPMTGWDDGGILSPSDIPLCGPSDYITQYAEKAAWDPVNLRLLFLGQAHGECYGGRFVSYTDATNTWAEEPWLDAVCKSGTPSSPCFSHAYDHNTVDPATGDFYYRQYSSRGVYRFRNGSWTTLPEPATQSVQCCGVLEFFPEMQRLIFIDGDWGIWAFDPSANTWSELANTGVADAAPGLPNYPVSSTSVFGLYNSVKKILLFGGDDHLYSMDASGQVKTLGAPPQTLGVTHSVTSYDPVSGAFIVLVGSAMYQYDVDSDAWTSLATPVPAVLGDLLGVGDGLIQAPITTYGVIMYAKYDFTSSKVYLYKHTAPPPCATDADCPTVGSCQSATCDVASGGCKLAPLADGTPCPAGTCNAGACNGGSDGGVAGGTGSGGSQATGGAPSGGASGGGPSGAAGSSARGAPSANDGGCSCRLGSTQNGTAWSVFALLAAALVALRDKRVRARHWARCWG